MKRIAIIIGAIACVIGLAACGSSGGAVSDASVQTIDMGDFTFEAPVDWGDVQQVSDDPYDVYTFGGDEFDFQNAKIERAVMSRTDEGDEKISESRFGNLLDKNFDTGQIYIASTSEVEDFTVGEYPARSGVEVVDYVGNGNSEDYEADYIIVFTPDLIHCVHVYIPLEGEDDVAGIETGKAVRDSIQLVHGG